jgi:CHAT domain-containing protein
VKLCSAILLLLPFSLLAQTYSESDSLKVHQWLSKGGQAVRTAKYDSSWYYYQQAHQLSEATGYHHGMMSSNLGFGLVHHYQREMEEAMEYYLMALDMTQQGIDLNHPDVELLYNNLGGAYIDMGFRLKAREFLIKALELQKRNQSQGITTAITYYNLGLVYLYFGENQSALHNFMAAYPAYLEHYGENGARVAQLYTNIGNIHDNLGNIEQAEEYFQRGIIIHLENHGPGYWNLAYPYTNLGSLYVKTGRRKQGLAYYFKSLELCQKNRKELIRLEALNHGALASYYLEEQLYDRSRNHAHQAVNIMQEAFYEEHPRISEFYTTVGQGYMEQSNFELAYQWFEKAKDLTIKGYGERHPQLAKLHLEQSKIFLETGDYSHAMQQAQQALIALSETFTSSDPKTNPEVAAVLNERLLMNILKQKGDVFSGMAKQQNVQENLVAALTHYQQAVSTIDHLRRGYLSESAKLFLQNYASEIYQKGVETAYQLYHLNRSKQYLAQAFYFMEKSKSSVLSEALQATNPTAILGVESELIAKEMTLDQQVKSLQLKLSDAQVNETDDTVRVKLRKDLFNAKARVDSLTDVIREVSPKYHQLKYQVEVLDLDQAEGYLPDHALALSFYEADSSWFVLGFSEQVTFLQIPKSELPVAVISRFRDAIGDPESDVNTVITDGQLIYEKLLKETLQSFPNAKQLMVIPDGNLNYLPLEALALDSASTTDSPYATRFLLEDYIVSYRNSMTLYAQKPDDRGYEQTYVGFAPSYPGNNPSLAMRESMAPLTGAKTEVERAGDMFKGEQYLDHQATEFEFKNKKHSSSILHLAMHATIDDKDPMRSRLLFTQESDSVEDGSLNAYEIYQLKLEAELAVLSACNTGVGTIHKGEGVMSLSRAFMYAGCPNIVMSLWQVQDQSSSQIMYTFFESLKKGLPKDEALREAKLKFLATADPYQAHPAQWAAFVLLGDYHPLSRPNNPWLWIGLGALFVVLGVLYFQQRRKKKDKRN